MEGVCNMTQGMLGEWGSEWVRVCRDIKIDNHYNEEFLKWGGRVNYNCQGRSKNFYKPVVFQVISADSWGSPRPFQDSPPVQNHSQNTKNIICFFHCTGIALTAQK